MLHLGPAEKCAREKCAGQKCAKAFCLVPVARAELWICVYASTHEVLAEEVQDPLKPEFQATASHSHGC